MSQDPEPIHFSIVGMGQAGRARQRRIEAHPRTRLVSTVSRREPDGPTFDDVCADPQVEAVAICTENALHPVQVAQALGAGKHVLVEYPLAPDGRHCEALVALAHRQGRILQVEFIGLLTQRHAQMAVLIAREPVVAFRLAFRGGWHRWVAVEAQARHWGQLAISRLLHIQRWFGPLRLHDVHLTERADGYQLDVRLESEQGVPIELSEQRGVELERGQEIILGLENGRSLIPERPAESGDLFARDLDRFVQRILDPNGVEPYVGNAEMIRVTRLAEAISQRAVGMFGRYPRQGV